MSVETLRSTRRHIPEDDTLHNHRCENLKSCMLCLLLDIPGIFFLPVYITRAASTFGAQEFFPNIFAISHSTFIY
jgi:hypothetical protein